MNAYKVMPEGGEAYVMLAPSIRHAAAFTRHWPRVVIRRLVLVSRHGIDAYATAGWTL